MFEKTKSKFFTNLGEHRLSPLMESSFALGLEYCDKVSSGSLQNNVPYLFCFPDKRYASFWLSVATLTNYFLEDYIESNNSVEINLSNGTLVDIYGSIARFIRKDIDTGKLIFSFSDLPEGRPFKESIQSVIKSTNKTRVNKYSHFINARKIAKADRNAISKILIPHEDDIINQEVLESKVLLVTGRGKMNEYRSMLCKTELNDQKLASIFPENTNLILKPDLESYKELSNSSYKTECDAFIQSFCKFRELNSHLEIKESLLTLQSFLDDSNSITLDFHNEFSSLCDDLDEGDYRGLKFIKDKYPGFQEIIPSKLRAVIINDLQSAIIYSKTIEAFLGLKIPVIIVGDRNISNPKNMGLFNELIDSNQDCYRINWNKKKILSLEDVSENADDYLDSQLWNHALRYAHQKIKMNISEGNEIDRLLPEVQSKISVLEGFDILKNKFYSHLYPALYALKNSNTITQKIQLLLEEFKLTYDEIRSLAIDTELCSLIDGIISTCLKHVSNSKSISDYENVFTNLLMEKEGKRIFLPVCSTKLNLPSSRKDKLIFSGFPYKEFSGQYLTKSVFEFFIPEITIQCWPIEGARTLNFLKRRFRAGYFTDSLLDNSEISTEILLKSNEEIETEIESHFILSESLNQEAADLDQILDRIHTLRYTKYSGDYGHGKTKYTVTCDVLNFIDDSFLFLPKNAKVLSESELNNGYTKPVALRFNELSVGLRVFKYKKDRTAYREISRQNQHVNGCFKTLEIWRNLLEKSFASSDESIEILANKLKEIEVNHKIEGSNPTPQNLKRWLFDDEVIAPGLPNLKLILLSQNIANIDEKTQELTEAYRTVLSYTIGLSSKIKKEISKYLMSHEIENEHFQISIEGTSLTVEAKTITGLEKNDLIIEYSNTRKILC